MHVDSHNVFTLMFNAANLDYIAIHITALSYKYVLGLLIWFYMHVLSYS